MVYEKSTKVCRKGLTKIVAPRVQKKNEMKQNADDIKQKQIWDQSISSSAMPLGMKIAIGIGSTAAVAAGGVGATIGAVIGALAIGIPSFGVAAGAGLVIGAVVGGGIGVGVAGATAGGAAVYTNVKEKKELEECKSCYYNNYYNYRLQLYTIIPICFCFNAVYKQQTEANEDSRSADEEQPPPQNGKN